MVTEEHNATRAVLTAPLTLDGDSDVNYGAPNLLQRVLSVLKSVRPGSDLTHFQLPPTFNLPKSQLQCFGESVFCFGKDYLSKCASAESPLDRLTSVVAWSISTAARPMVFGVAPYNPILGETHHVSRGNLNVLLEQVSHHPPVSALHATDDQKQLEMIWCQHPVPKFFGTSVETEVQGKRQLKLLKYGETYVMNSPKLLIRFLPVPGVDWVGHVQITCKETGLEAELSYKYSIFGGRNHRLIKGKIIDSSSSKTIYDIEGHWDRTVTIKDVSSGKLRLIYDAKEAISGLSTPYVEDPKGISERESAVVWGEVSRGILGKEWEKAREAKRSVEQRQRELQKERDSRGEKWAPKHFTVTHSKEDGWDCSPIESQVHPAPIAVPL
ncbi:oxysterol-binding protein-related protein 4C-like [Punica granatum]|uniref:Uncharacterized protein n=2 Tax=Punica granatum TaxID=22663 RepID=A0A2I0JK72_PUNGR|nr:oxysterol-binding protein-related protein 4C-like [Punica granatum]PKI56685.1 hypothetical protein CRG98_022935 [Punica granatum]